jgi:sterol desaturase/sphingolipid hydroxylase (fatty acid hydroxylase superfamily)
MLEAPFDPVKLAVPFFILAILLEVGLGRLRLAKAEYEAWDTLASLGMGLLRGVPALLTAGLVFAATVWAWEHRIFTVPFTAWWGWVAIFFLEDLT